MARNEVNNSARCPGSEPHGPSFPAVATPGIKGNGPSVLNEQISRIRPDKNGTNRSPVANRIPLLSRPSGLLSSLRSMPFLFESRGHPRQMPCRIGLVGKIAKGPLDLFLRQSHNPADLGNFDLVGPGEQQ